MDKNWLPNEHEGIHRRTFFAMMGIAGPALAGLTLSAKWAAHESKTELKGREKSFYVRERVFDQKVNFLTFNFIKGGI